MRECSIGSVDVEGPLAGSREPAAAVPPIP